MKNIFITALLLAALSGCASSTINYPPMISIGKDGRTSVKAPVAIKDSGIDRTGRDVFITRDSLSIIEHQPNPLVPHTQHLVTDKKGNVVGVETQVAMATSNASNTTNAIHNLWSGVAKFAIGSITAMASTIGLANAAASQASAVTNANKVTSVASTKAASSVQQAQIAADVTKATAVAAPATGTVIDATTKAMVVPVP
jgi:hypothetical protein